MLERIPPEILEYLLVRYLSVRSSLNVSLTCRSLNVMVTELCPLFWKKILRTYFRGATSSIPNYYRRVLTFVSDLAVSRVSRRICGFSSFLFNFEQPGFSYVHPEEAVFVRNELERGRTASKAEISRRISETSSSFRIVDVSLLIFCHSFASSVSFTVWNLETGKIRSFFVVRNLWVESQDWTSNGSHIFVIRYDYSYLRIDVYDIMTGKRISTFQDESKDFYYRTVISPPSKTTRKLGGSERIRRVDKDKLFVIVPIEKEETIGFVTWTLYVLSVEAITDLRLLDRLELVKTRQSYGPWSFVDSESIEFKFFFGFLTGIDDGDKRKLVKTCCIYDSRTGRRLVKTLNFPRLDSNNLDEDDEASPISILIHNNIGQFGILTLLFDSSLELLMLDDFEGVSKPISSLLDASTRRQDYAKHEMILAGRGKAVISLFLRPSKTYRLYGQSLEGHCPLLWISDPFQCPPPNQRPYLTSSYNERILISTADGFCFYSSYSGRKLTPSFKYNLCPTIITNDKDDNDGYSIYAQSGLSVWYVGILEPKRVLAIHDLERSYPASFHLMELS